MRVQRVLMPGSEAESWTLLGDDQIPVEPVERFLGYLTSIEKSPNTVKAYAHDLKDWFTYLTLHGLGWQVVTVEDVAGFVAWLRLPPEGRDGQVAVLPTVENHCSAASVNRKLAALTSFCEFHARRGVSLAGLLTTMQPAGRRGAATSYKPFLHHVTKSGPQPRRTIKLKTSRPRPKVLTAAAGAGDPGCLRSPARSPAVCCFAGLRGQDRRGAGPAARGHGDRRAGRHRHAAARTTTGPAPRRASPGPSRPARS